MIIPGVCSPLFPVTSGLQRAKGRPCPQHPDWAVCDQEVKSPLGKESQRLPGIASFSTYIFLPFSNTSILTLVESALLNASPDTVTGCERLRLY